MCGLQRDPSVSLTEKYSLGKCTHTMIYSSLLLFSFCVGTFMCHIPEVSVTLRTGKIVGNVQKVDWKSIEAKEREWSKQCI
jgi:hypothetical protein